MMTIAMGAIETRWRFPVHNDKGEVPMLNASWKKLLGGVAAGAALALAGSSLALAGDRDDDDKGNDFRISTLSTKPDLVSGGGGVGRIDVPRKGSLPSGWGGVDGRKISSAVRAHA